jgi:hypothetical protein
MRSLVSLGQAQATRALAAPARIAAREPLREGVLEGFRQRNAALDWLFYDLGVLDPADATRLAPRYAAEGAILRVEPGTAAPVQLWQDFDAWQAAGTPNDGAALVVAGVGSSALGAAAFARNVADAMQAPVLAVVSGYGLGDLLTEATGGFFLFGMLNSWRHMFEPIDDASRLTLPAFPGSAGSVVSAVRRSLDVRTVTALLAARDFPLIAGHSKGNLVIAEAMETLAQASPARAAALADAAAIVTFSAKVFMPPPFRDVVDVMGGLDGFGLMNSRLSIATDVRVPGAWHHTNTDLPCHLPVTRVLREVLAARA